ncbi:MAG: M48 family metallopeptidase [Draconibacterium sp.]|nr:M48 family metallopeptidase [Draconibacterium sp.]
MSGKVVQYKQIGTVTFLKNRRSKNIKISVKPDKSVLVSFPFYCTTKEILTFVHKNEDWILAQQQKVELRRNKIDANSKIETKLYSIEFVLGEKYDVVTQKATVRITVIDFESDKTQDYIEYIITQIYRFEAKKLLVPRLVELAAKQGFQFQRATIRNNKRNWGSCSSKNNISLNLQMMKLPDELIDYILLHELVHTQIKNHGPKFWEKLNEITNNKARELAKQVKRYSTYTL